MQVGIDLKLYAWPTGRLSTTTYNYIITNNYHLTIVNNTISYSVYYVYISEVNCSVGGQQAFGGNGFCCMGPCEGIRQPGANPGSPNMHAGIGMPASCTGPR